jgi:hypothetical protein
MKSNYLYEWDIWEDTFVVRSITTGIMVASCTTIAAAEAVIRLLNL